MTKARLASAKSALVVAIIPARYDSIRFPGKPLADIGGKPMIQHVYENTSRASGLDRVLVATDDARIFDAVKSFGGEAVMTSKKHVSGTDRLAEAAAQLKAGWVLNVQGDLPFIRPRTISRILSRLRLDPALPMATAKTAIVHLEEWSDPNVVKVVTDRQGYALYFSRAAIPYRREWDGRDSRLSSAAPWGYRHLGVYAYRRDFLLRFSRLRPVALERSEGLEQLRALAHGYPIWVADVDEATVEVNTPDDLAQAEAYLRESRNG